MRRKDYEKEAIMEYSAIYTQYINQLLNISASRFKWNGLPDSVSERWLEKTLQRNGVAVFFKDEVLGYLALETMLSGQIGVYDTPINNTAYAANGYNMSLNQKNSVLIWNNLNRTTELEVIELYARQLTEIDRTITINLNSQKTPLAIATTNKNKLSMINAYMKYNGNVPVIFENADNADFSQNISVINTNAPYLIDKLYDYKVKKWNEALTALGVPNMEIKRERRINAEAELEQGDYIATLNSALKAREQACDEINNMFNLKVEVSIYE